MTRVYVEVPNSYSDSGRLNRDFSTGLTYPAPHVSDVA